MRILRTLSLGCLVAACTACVALVCADRLAHPDPARTAHVAAVEPVATGSIGALVDALAAKPRPAKPAAPVIPNGFDTERLHALMRGDPILPSRR